MIQWCNAQTCLIYRSFTYWSHYATGGPIKLISVLKKKKICKPKTLVVPIWENLLTPPSCTISTTNYIWLPSIDGSCSVDHIRKVLLLAIFSSWFLTELCLSIFNFITLLRSRSVTYETYLEYRSLGIIWGIWQIWDSVVLISKFVEVLENVFSKNFNLWLLGGWIA